MKNWIINLLIKLGLWKSPITVSEAIEIVKNAPEDTWCVLNLNHKGKCCFLGHLAKARNIDLNQPLQRIQKNPTILHIENKIVQFVKEKHNENISSAYVINDNRYINGYNENHPKLRMLHVLNDMKEAGID